MTRSGVRSIRVLTQDGGELNQLPQSRDLPISAYVLMPDNGFRHGFGLLNWGSELLILENI